MPLAPNPDALMRHPQGSGAEKGMSPYAPMRTRSGGTDFDDIDDLRRELGARLDQEAAWKQEVQQQMKSFTEHERELARIALDEVRMAGSTL